MRLIVFLQNGWSPLYAGGTWPRPSWLKALRKSHSGRRLKQLGDEEHPFDFDICHNMTPITGESASSSLPPDRNHVMDIINKLYPTHIVTCGKTAEEFFKEQNNWPGHLLSIPHPASRTLTNGLYDTAREYINKPWTGRVALRQSVTEVIEQVLGFTK